MVRDQYLRPTAIFADMRRSKRQRAVDTAAPVAGRGDLAFALIELIKRRDSVFDRPLLGVAELRAMLAEGRASGSIERDFDQLQAPRAPFAGLPMDRTHIMGIVNVTPDSFSDGGRHNTTDTAVDHALRLADAGAAILDIGGESTRPGSDAVATEEELRRVIPVIERLRPRTSAKISVDTRKAAVMKAAAAAGADIINDVSALTHDPAALETAVATGLPVMLMHAQGDPKTMNDDPVYDDVALDVFDYLERRIAECEAAGIPRSRIVADPGIGFGKHLHHNIAVMAALALYQGLGVPLLLGASRKKMIGQLCDVKNAADRVPGSLACAIAAAAAGYQFVRVHDVAETHQALSVWRASVLGQES